MSKLAPFALVLIAFLGSCTPLPVMPTAAASPVVPAATSPAPPLSLANFVNTDGNTWTFGQGLEPTAGPVTSCYPVDHFTLYGNGPTVTFGRPVNVLMMPPELRNAKSPGSLVTGTNVNGHLEVTGKWDDAAATFSLDFNTKTQHLSGTRNGTPFWAAPFIQKADCITPQDYV